MPEMALRRPKESIELEKRLTRELEMERSEVLSRVYRHFGEELSIHQLHAVIGGKNNLYTDCVRMQFQDSDDFVARWLEGLFLQYESELLEARRGLRTNTHTSAYRILILVQDPVVRSYVFKFLRRNFCRQFVARTRVKPPENLWSIWFGSGTMAYGLLTAPAFRVQVWKNDKSEIRRVPYTYWTVGHVLHEGLIAPEEKAALSFKCLSELLTFYRFVLKRLSRSQYERNVAENYIQYLEASSDPLDEPFLIPEFRYGGLELKHKYRLDFTVFNGTSSDLSALNSVRTQRTALFAI